MSWCDKLASTPAIGVRLDRSYDPISVTLERVAPIISSWSSSGPEEAPFTIDQEDLFSCTLQTLDGYSYFLGPDRLAVEFRHRLRLQGQSAGPPVAELLSKPRPYTELLEDVTERLLKVVELVTAGRARKLERFGVVTTTQVIEDEMPPGVARFLNHVRKPWGTTADAYNVELTTKLTKATDAAHQDRCIHHIRKAEDRDGLVFVKLDWQRWLDESKGLSMSSLPGLLSEARKNALAYFEDIGQGERFDA